MARRKHILAVVLGLTLATAGVWWWMTSPHWKAVRLLGELRNPTREYDFRGRLEAYHPWQRVDALIEIGPPAVPVLIRALRDDRTRHYAAYALGEIGDRCAVDPLIAQLRTGADDTGYVAEALGKLKDDRAINPLIAALKQESSLVRSRAATALGSYDNPESVNALTALAEDEDQPEVVHLHAQAALQKLHSDSVSATEPADGLVPGEAPPVEPE